MLSDENFDQWCLHMDLPEPTKQLIQRIRTSPPVRSVKSAAGNVSGRYPSQKMGMAIQFESHTLELPGIITMEHDVNVLAYFDQPIRIKLNYKSKDGKRNLGVMHTPDFFVIQEQRADFVEYKMNDKLEELAQDAPHRYVCAADGTWSCPPGEAYAAEHKLGYVVFSSSQINWMYQRNIRFLEDYLHPNAPTVPDDLHTAILTEVLRYPGITLRDLLMQHQTEWADAIYRMIALDGLYADLYATPLPDPDRAHIFVDSATAHAYATLSEGGVSGPRPQMLVLQVGTRVMWDGVPWDVLNVGMTSTTLCSERNQVRDVPREAMDTLIQQGKITGLDLEAFESASGGIDDVLKHIKPPALEEAHQRLILLDALQSSSSAMNEVVDRSIRSLQRYQRKQREALQAGLNVMHELIPRTHAKGNRQRKLPQDVEDLLISA